MSKIIRTRVVKILSDTSVVLGAGIEDGVTEGMEFVIYQEGSDIVDPVSQESLGRIEHTKGHVFADAPQDKFCVARTKTKIEAPSPPPLGGFNFTERILRDAFTASIEREGLKVENASPEAEVDRTVRVGDPARSVPSGGRRVRSSGGVPVVG
jgi:hypothetical protein